MTAAPLLQARNLTVIRGQRAILQDVSLHVAEEDFVTLIGPNGAGKSMLLQCLMRFYTPEQGSVQQRPGLRIGYMPQRLLPDAGMPIRVERFLRLRRQAPPATMDVVAAETGVSALLQRDLHVLSGGELQRVLLARALLGDPHLLVLDEPAQNLDIAGRVAFYKLLQHVYRRRRLGILMVSHDLHMVMASTRRVICLYHHVCCSGAPHLITRDPAFISLFGDDTARMMAVYHHSHDHRHEDTAHA